MDVRPTRFLGTIVALLAVATSFAAPAVAQRDEMSSPFSCVALVEQVSERSGVVDETILDALERRCETRWTSWLERSERRVERLAEREARRAERQVAKEARKAAREERKAAREARRAAGRMPIDQLYANVPDDGTGVIRTDLGIAEPRTSPGQALGLWHYLIPAGAELPPHTHPGWQLARVTSGELEYVVESGEGMLLRADGTSEPMGPGTYVLGPGDGVIENPELVHFGANRGTVPVTLISATLFEAGDPISTIVELDDGVEGEATTVSEEVGAAG